MEKVSSLSLRKSARAAFASLAAMAALCLAPGAAQAQSTTTNDTRVALLEPLSLLKRVAPQALIDRLIGGLLPD